MLFREPLNPHVPALAQHNVSPRVSVMVTCVLLNVALMNAIAEVTLRRTFRRLLFASCLVCCFATMVYLVSLSVDLRQWICFDSGFKNQPWSSNHPNRASLQC